MLAHSATRSSGATSLLARKSANASAVPGSSTTHFTATLASITSVFTAPRVLRAVESPMVSDSAYWLVGAVAPLNLRKRVQLPQLKPAGESTGARLQPSGAPFKPGDQIIIKVANMQVTGHRSSGYIAINALVFQRFCQSAVAAADISCGYC